MAKIKMGKPGAVFWVLGALFLLWNAAGCYFYWLDVSLTDAQYSEIYGEAMTAVRSSYPNWAVGAYALAVWGGLLAAILYLLRKAWAYHLFMISFVMAVISNAWIFLNADAKAAAGGSFWVMPVVVFVLGLIEIIWSRKKVNDGTLS